MNNSVIRNNRGVIHLALPVILLLIAAVVALIFFGVIKNPLKNLKLGQAGPKVDLKKEYKNPFKQETQYVNPFETYKNPFTVAK
ncbi:MAG: hypothetical protein G01um10147_1048 [Microgenomates group bacterium Gr01-1014_7]|nr:MAG: hypothetical protein G01um10147_1048 [Microgenomates group bacterium Gr01-1014_7]